MPEGEVSQKMTTAALEAALRQGGLSAGEASQYRTELTRRLTQTFLDEATFTGATPTEPRGPARKPDSLPGPSTAHDPTALADFPPPAENPIGQADADSRSGSPTEPTHADMPPSTSGAGNHLPPKPFRISEDGRSGEVRIVATGLERILKKTFGKDIRQFIALSSISAVSRERKRVGSDVVTLQAGTVTYTWKMSSDSEEFVTQLNAIIYRR